MAAEKASALGVTPMARIVGQAVSGLAPKWILMTPVQAVHKLLQKVGWTLEDVDLIELNEAFSAQALAVIRELGADPTKVNVNGGAVALGHPYRREWRENPHNAPVCAEAAESETWYRDAVSGWRERCGAGGRKSLDQSSVIGR